jgi:hypothetical protein
MPEPSHPVPLRLTELLKVVKSTTETDRPITMRLYGLSGNPKWTLQRTDTLLKELEESKTLVSPPSRVTDRTVRLIPSLETPRQDRTLPIVTPSRTEILRPIFITETTDNDI